LSFLESFDRSNLKKRPANPKTSNIFAIFEPITLPIIASIFGGEFVAAMTVIANSGADVPNAIMVKPISIGDKLK
jgi:hypothetical protein